ncbi:MAG: aminomethyl-transferring glycine dehydrogenase subunit GcvPB [Rhodospirillaceae bacterium]|jgi:glycine dehydrogenase subunit 2|nr:aminomethyl-transferring glycine dehydrogenase subunit GcvPB [Rhodospirillaceae bacterium]MBT5194893.1 aminomethyl-transferring glycine dehydrogenase subunit GcvPB [Rhodospirillaceae bacterium]MBT6426608.1 aminomethyl-transferring glycine dehydrogenase subunit GcvPB [Rhodospirillaceae bacterium]MBT7756531.1 aminomethyl-transferring glycine dehydrogenase subunit GcvPB [Rhodospirillaceae bacterium]
MADPNAFQTSSGHRGLDLAEPLIFELDGPGRCGVDLPAPPDVENRLGGLERQAPIGLPGLSEPQVVRHFVRLSRNNFAIDAGLYPLGSCTMKHNPRLNEKLARLPGFADLHPLQPEQTVQGALELVDTLSDWLLTLTGMSAIAMSPAAGAHGELCGLMCIRAALEAKGDPREVVLVPTSAHGTNPATAAICGYRVEQIPADAGGRVDLAALKEKLGPHVAAIMLTNPNTCGLFESQIIEIAEAVHDAGAYFYCDGANFNAIMGKVRPGDLGIDCMHLNLHKTFSTPHGGGGPGSGPVVLAETLAPFAPLPMVQRGEDGLTIVEQKSASAGTAESFGRLKGFHGQMGMFVRALAFILSHGADGLRQASEDAVLNANYVLARLQDLFSTSFPGPCMHEVLFDDRFLKDTGVSTLDFAKAMIDEGFHPMTMYFPLVVSGAMLIEPTESESKDNLDQFIASMRHLAERAIAGDVEFFTGAPYLAPYRRLDETQAARKPVLRWLPDVQEAAE